MPRLKMSQKEFDEVYEITEDTEATPIPEPDIPSKQDTTPEFLTQEEEEHDTHLFEDVTIEDVE